MNPQICPKCGEENPAEAILCWACYTPLDGVNAALPRTYDALLKFQPDTEAWLNKASAIAPYLLFSSLIPQGWWRGRTRFYVLGVSLGIMALTYARDKREESRKTTNSHDESPIAKIADTIFFYALKDQATKIRIALLDHMIQIEYQLEWQWREQMKIPTYIWQPLRNELESRAGMGNIEFAQDGDKAIFSLRSLVEPPHQEITLTRLENN